MTRLKQTDALELSLHLMGYYLQTHRGPTPLEVIYHQAGHELAITGRFSLLLSTYDIKAPRFLLVKVADEQQVSFSLAAVHR